MSRFGRRIPSDWKHVEKYPLRQLMRPSAPPNSEHTLRLPTYRILYNQGDEGACVGFSCSWMMSILNRRMYAARRLYLEAQFVDEWNDTPPEEGTSVRAAMDVLRDKGHWRIWRQLPHALPELKEGITENRWALSADEVRTTIYNNTPVVLGVNWYAEFSRPVEIRSGSHNQLEWWIGKGDIGRVTGGHAICAFAMSDRRQAIRLVNSWGLAYPHVWIPYSMVDRLIHENGEAALVTDRV